MYIVDVLQEVASRGLGLLYELTDPEHKEQLLQYLVNTLMEGKKSVLYSWKFCRELIFASL